ncbi:MAG: N-acetylmuramoyl-L-alanine amidase [Lentimicrobium sp.]|jgi:N-acetylmuramoyl-L-alanine amidase|nr:N-acetylmuramoyl-L-alanine amidase [Lentimicrobium sp.]
MQKLNLKKGLLGIFIALFASLGAMLFIPQEDVYKPVETANNIEYVIVAGHGDADNGQYLTPGKRSPIWPDGHQVLEGRSTKLYALELTASLESAGLDATILNPLPYDMSLQERTKRINDMYKQDKRLFVIYVHHNAQQLTNANYVDKLGNKGFLSVADGGATGAESYTSVGRTRSDTFNNDYLIPQLEKDIPEVAWRYGSGTKGKEANFYVLKNTIPPGVLIEWCFMTTYPDSQKISSKDIRTRWVQSVTNACLNYENSLC